MLSGMKFEDLYADGVKDAGDPAVIDPVFEIHIYGNGFLGEEIDVIVPTVDGYWNFQKDYQYNKKTDLVPAQLTVCEVPQTGWTQSYPTPSCYELTIEPASVAEVQDPL